MTEKKILILGDEEQAPYHPLSRVLPGTREALESLGEISVCTDYRGLTISDLQLYDFIISYLDDYRHLNGFDDILADYLACGGRLLALHNGIISRAGSKLEKAYGGNFVTHPPRCLLAYRTAKRAEWLGVKAFKLEEEAYMVRQLDSKNQIFLTFHYQGEDYPAGWCRNYKKGRMIYLAPGHDEKTAESKTFRRLLRECVIKSGFSDEL